MEPTVSSLSRRVAAFAALRNVADLSRFLERNPDLLSRDAEGLLRAEAFRALDTPKPDRSISLYLRYRLLAECSRAGIPTGFETYFGTLDPQLPPDLAAIRAILRELLRTQDDADEWRIVQIALLAGAAALAHPGWPSTPVQFRADLLTNAAYAEFRAYMLGASALHLERAIELGEQSLLLGDAADDSRDEVLNNLANALLYRLENESGDVADLNKAIELLTKVTAGQDLTHPLGAGARINLASALRLRFRLRAVPADLDQCISTMRALHHGALEATLQVPVMNNLANALIDRYELTRELGDLEEAIGLYDLVERTATLTPDERAYIKGTLADALVHRYAATGDRSDADRAVQLFGEGIDASSPGSGEQCGLVRRLVRLHLLVFEYEDGIEQLDASVERLTVSLGHPSISADDHRDALVLLGDTYIRRYLVTRDLEDLRRALERHEEAERPRLRRRSEVAGL